MLTVSDLEVLANREEYSLATLAFSLAIAKQVENLDGFISHYIIVNRIQELLNTT